MKFLLLFSTVAIFGQYATADHEGCQLNYAGSENYKIVFNLYTKANRDEPQILDPNNASSIVNSNFEDDTCVKMFFHGLESKPTDKEPIALKNAIVDNDDCNVILVDWTPATFTILLAPFAPKKMDYLCSYVNYLYCHLNTLKGTIPQDMHYIGHSLGGQAAGVCGNKFTAEYDDLISRVTALDPAGSLFETPLIPESGKLHKRSALEVDVTHTYRQWNSLAQGPNIGTANFIPNGGKIQPGCKGKDKADPIPFAGTPADCSHKRAIDLYTESVRFPERFQAFKAIADKYENFKKGELTGEEGRMGYRTQGQGIFFFDTFGEPDFGGQHMKAQAKNNRQCGKLEINVLGGNKNKSTSTLNFDENQEATTMLLVPYGATGLQGTFKASGFGFGYCRTTILEYFTLRSVPLDSPLLNHCGPTKMENGQTVNLPGNC